MRVAMGESGGLSHKVYDAKALLKAMDERHDQYDKFEDQLGDLKKAFHEIANLDDFKGEGAGSIKNFYKAQVDVVQAWIEFVHVQKAFLKGIPDKVSMQDLDGKTVIDLEFLERELEISDHNSRELVQAQHDDLQKIFHQIDDIMHLEPFSTKDLKDEFGEAEKTRKDTITKVNNLDEGLVNEYKTTEEQEQNVLALYSQLIDSTSKNGTTEPVNFNAQAYHNSDIYQLQDKEKKRTEQYLDAKKKDHEKVHEIQEEENKSWGEKAWETTKTFVGEVSGYNDFVRATKGVDPVTGEKLSAAQRVTDGAMALAGFIPVIGWAGRAAKGGEAIYKTAKGVSAAHKALDAYKTTKSMEYLHKTEKGAYGLATANGMGEAATGRDMFGNELSNEERKESFVQALTMMGVGGTAHTVDRLHAKNQPYVNQTRKPKSVDKKTNSHVTSLA